MQNATKIRRRYLSELNLPIGTPLIFKYTDITVYYDGGKKVRYNNEVISLSEIVEKRLNKNIRGSVPDVYEAWRVLDGRSIRELFNIYDKVGSVIVSTASTSRPLAQPPHRVQVISMGQPELTEQTELFVEEGEKLSQGAKANLSGKKNEDFVMEIIKGLSIPVLTMKEYREISIDMIPSKFFVVRQYDYIGFANNPCRADFALMYGKIAYMNIEARKLNESSSIAERLSRVNENAEAGPFIKTLAVLTGEGFNNDRTRREIEVYKGKGKMEFTTDDKLECMLAKKLLEFYQVQFQ